jgi:hypothetical protein
MRTSSRRSTQANSNGKPRAFPYRVRELEQHSRPYEAWHLTPAEGEGCRSGALLSSHTGEQLCR